MKATGSCHILLAILALTTATALLRAEPRTWDNGAGADTSWQNALNWNPDGVPTSTSDILFTNTGIPVFGIVIPIPNNAAANSITISTNRALTLQNTASFFNLTSGGVTRQDVAGLEQNVSIDANLRMLADGLWNINGSGSLTARFLGEVGGARSLTKTGNGLLEIQSPGYTGTTTVSQGTLRLDSSFSIGFADPAPVSVASGATLALSESQIRGITLSGTGVAGLGALHSLNNSVAGLVTLATDGVVISSEAGMLQLTGGITDGASSFSWTKRGAGAVQLLAAGAYEGDTLINEGTVEARNTSALGTGSVTVNPGATLSIGAPNVTNPITLGGALAGSGPDGGSSYKGIATLTGNATLSGDGFLDITGTITDNGNGFNVIKTGSGSVSITGTNAVTGTFTVAGGILRINAAPPSGGPITVQQGGTLEFGDNLAINRPLHISGNGAFAFIGALFAVGGDNTWLGPITLDGDSSIGAGANLLISGPITGGFALTKVQNGNLTLTNPGNSFTSLTVGGGGKLILQSSAPIPATAPITVMPGAQLSISGNSVFNQPLFLASQIDFASGDNTWAGPIALQGSSFITVGGPDHLTVSGNITGAFTLNLGSVPEAFFHFPGEVILSGSNSYGDTNVFDGVLTLQSNGALPSGKTIFVETDATLQLRNNITTTTSLLLNGNGLAGQGALFNGQGNNTIIGPIKMVTNTSIGVAAATTLTLSSVVSDDTTPLPLIKVGLGTLVFSSANAYRGGTFVNGGTLSIDSDAFLGDLAGLVTLNNGGKLLITANTTSARTFNLNSGSIQVNGGVAFSYAGATVTGGFLRGPGTHAITGVANFSGVTALAGANITQSAPTTLNNFTNAGNLISSAPLTWDGGFNTSAGALTTNSTANVSGFENTGAITINNGGNLTNSGNNLTSGGGGRITINPGAALNLGSTSLDLNGSLLINNGIINGTTNVNFGALAKGSGVYGAVNVTDGGRFSPGNSPGTVSSGSTTWNSGGSYLVEIGNDTHDMWNVNGELKLNSSAQHTFTIALASLDDLTFDSSHDYDWPVLHADDGFAGFDPAQLALDFSAFKEDLAGGKFSLRLTSNDILVHFSPVPEPAAMGAVLAGILLVKRRSRRLSFQGEVC